MSNPVFLADDLSGAHVLLTGPEGHHAATVRRLRTGEVVDVVDGLGTRATCVVTGVAKDLVRLDVTARSSEQAPAPRLVLAQALAKGDRGELAVELATEVGVDQIVPWTAARCVQQWHGERGERSLEKWRSTAREAAKQSRRAWWPVVSEPQRLAGLAALPGQLLVLHASAAQPLTGIDLAADGDVVLIVGPEGGLTSDELDALVEAGAAVVRLGRSVLRTSTAGAAAAAVVSARTGRW